MKASRYYWIAAVVAIGLVAAAVAYFTTRPASSELRPLTVAVARSHDSTLVYVADSQGYFREEGLNVTLQPHEFGKPALDSMLDGKADLATVAETPIMLAVMKGKPLAVIAGIFGSDRNMGIVARRDKEIIAPKGLAGKRIAAAAGTNGDYFRYAFLAANGVPMGTVEAVALRPAEMADALQAGRVDAVAVWHPFLRLCEKKLGNDGVTFYGEAVYTYTFNVAASRRILEDDRRAVESFLRALKKAEHYVQQNPDRAIEIVAHATGADREMLKELWGGFNFRMSLEQALLISMENEAGWAIKEKLVERKTLPNFLDFIYFDGLEKVSPEAMLITH
ncbi:MAG TPA: NrtA/SsuA/CpmA family ABC transporter substrate-binding protein [Gallionella sp.]|nr:NrtA/SsuA/CpmA family ABC transporter substrate-binding protein [Gallionella sp.]